MKPEISIQQGLTIGYSNRRRLTKATPLNLATARKEIRLTPGRHLLLARNGRGKTTLLKTLAGLLPAREGNFETCGTIQYVDEELRFDPELTARMIFRSFFQNGMLEKSLEYAERLELNLDKPYGKLSKGNRQKVTLILAEVRATQGNGQILLLDEPFSGLDYHARQEMDTIWGENAEDVLRLVCVHPDEPTLQAHTALLIREGEIEQLQADGEVDWLETREKLN